MDAAVTVVPEAVMVTANVPAIPLAAMLPSRYAGKTVAPGTIVPLVRMVFAPEAETAVTALTGAAFVVE